MKTRRGEREEETRREHGEATSRRKTVPRRWREKTRSESLEGDANFAATRVLQP